jgi:hypothetical protein
MELQQNARDLRPKHMNNPSSKGKGYYRAEMNRKGRLERSDNSAKRKEGEREKGRDDTS